MKIVTVAGLRFGEGLPKLCIPLTAPNLPALLEEAVQARALPADLFEWRMDGYFGSYSGALAELRGSLGKPLLCTLRTRAEGGRSDLNGPAYEDFLLAVLEQGGPDLLDVELSAGEDRVQRILASAHRRGTGVIVSRHDFAETPPPEEMRRVLRRMKELGADLPKLAVTPQSAADVLALMTVTEEMSRELGPVITMSMGALGKLSRVSGGLTGSCLTFGAGRNASAPGQLNAEDLKAILEDLQP